MPSRGKRHKRGREVGGRSEPEILLSVNRGPRLRRWHISDDKRVYIYKPGAGLVEIEDYDRKFVAAMWAVAKATQEKDWSVEDARP